jgi:nitrogen fixation protein NifU and related proteins
MKVGTFILPKMNDKDQIYREELMEVYRKSKAKGKILDPTVEVSEKNPMCGDEIVLQLKIDNGIITDAKFDGSACAVSVISSNYLLEFLVGKTVGEAKQISKEQLLDMIGINLTTSRVKCATLVLKALEDAIQKIESR